MLKEDVCYQICLLTNPFHFICLSKTWLKKEFDNEERYRSDTALKIRATFLGGKMIFLNQSLLSVLLNLAWIVLFSQKFVYSYLVTLYCCFGRDIYGLKKLEMKC